MYCFIMFGLGIKPRSWKESARKAQKCNNKLRKKTLKAQKAHNHKKWQKRKLFILFVFFAENIKHGSLKKLTCQYYFLLFAAFLAFVFLWLF